MKVVIDADLCTGHGRCYVLSPTVFSDDERGNGQVIGDGILSTPEQVEAGQRAVRSCPERAISIIED